MNKLLTEDNEDKID